MLFCVAGYTSGLAWIGIRSWTDSNFKFLTTGISATYLPWEVAEPYRSVGACMNTEISVFKWRACECHVGVMGLAACVTLP